MTPAALFPRLRELSAAYPTARLAPVLERVTALVGEGRLTGDRRDLDHALQGYMARVIERADAPDPAFRPLLEAYLAHLDRPYDWVAWDHVDVPLTFAFEVLRRDGAEVHAEITAWLATSEAAGRRPRGTLSDLHAAVALYRRVEAFPDEEPGEAEGLLGSTPLDWYLQEHFDDDPEGAMGLIDAGLPEVAYFAAATFPPLLVPVLARLATGPYGPLSRQAAEVLAYNRGRS